RRSTLLGMGCFFFSSRRRHTRFSRDWSSDVCSSDLKNDRSCVLLLTVAGWQILLPGDISRQVELQLLQRYLKLTADILLLSHHRSEERRIGKECRSRRWRNPEETNTGSVCRRS